MTALTILLGGMAAGLLGGMAAGAAMAQEPPGVFAEFGGVELRGQAPHYAEIGIGVFDLAEEDSAAGRIELKGGDKLWFLGPAIGLLANTDGGVFGYGGVYADIAYGNFVLTPFLALGGYAEGDGPDLGGVFQFRSSIALSYEFAGKARLGLSFAHISNAGIYDDNPGAEEIYVFYSMPF
jgi:hypothetical protein